MRGAIHIRAGHAVVQMTSSYLFSVFWEDNAALLFVINLVPTEILLEARS